MHKHFGVRTKTDKIMNNGTSCRTHMAIVILQEKKNKWSPRYPDKLHRLRNELELKSLRNDKT